MATQREDDRIFATAGDGGATIRSHHARALCSPRHATVYVALLSRAGLIWFGGAWTPIRTLLRYRYEARRDGPSSVLDLPVSSHRRHLAVSSKLRAAPSVVSVSVARWTTVNRGGPLLHVAIAFADEWHLPPMASGRDRCPAHHRDSPRGGRLSRRSELVPAQHRLHSRNRSDHRWALPRSVADWGRRVVVWQPDLAGDDRI